MSSKSSVLWGVAFAALCQGAPAFAQDAGANANAEEEIVVTGTILRGNASSINPLGVLDAEDMAVRGQTTVAETLETLSGNAGGSLPNSFTANGAFAAGASAVSLRGLLTSNTLVLVDGLRPAYYPLADDATRNFVDLNTIPQSIIDRVEVLKDGASSTYGADAIAGVINIITRREFNGFTADYDQSFRGAGSGAEQIHASGLWGHGDLSTDGYNFYISAEYQHDDTFYSRDADFFPATTEDLSSICGPSNSSPGETCANNASMWGLQYDGSFSGLGTTRNSGSTTAIIRRRNATNTGFDASDDFALLDTSCNAHSVPGVITPAAAAMNGIAGFNAPVNVCTLDRVQEYGVIMPEDTRFSLSARTTFNLGDSAEAYLMGNYYQNETFNILTPESIRQQMTPSTTGVRFSTATNATPANLPVWVCPLGSVSYVCNGSEVGAVLNPQNPYAADGRDAGLFYRFGDFEHSNRTFAQTFRAAGGVSGDFEMQGHEYRFNVGASGMLTDLKRTTEGALYFPNLMAALRQGTYNFVDPDLNSDAIRQFVAPTSIQRSNSRLVQVQASVSTDLFELPGGAAEGGLSIAARYEALDNPSENSDRLGPQNRYLSINPFGAAGSRDTESMAFEVNLPLLTSVDVNVSGRYDTYSTGQSSFSPKVGLRFEPFDFLAFRGTYSQGFRIPSFAESFAEPTTGFSTVNAPANWCDANQGTGAPGSGDVAYCQSYAQGNTTIASPDLEPETSENINVGFVVRPFGDWSFSADYYSISQSDVIGSQATAPAVAAYYAGTPIPAGVIIIPDAPNPAFPLSQPRVGFVQSGLQNLGERATHGWDFQVSGSYDLGGIEWNTSGEATWLQSLTQEFPGQAEQEYAGTIGPFTITAASGTPNWRLNWQNTFTAGPATLGVTVYWTEGYLSVAEDNAGSHDDKSCLSGTSGGTPATYLDGTTPIVCRVDDSFYVDLHGSYDVTDALQFYVNVNNALGEDPAFDPTTYGAASPSYNPAWGTRGILGRVFTIGARATF